MRKQKQPDLSKPDGIRWWESQCGFTDAQAAEALAVPFRTFCRWKSKGIPKATRASKLESDATTKKMAEILALAEIAS